MDLDLYMRVVWRFRFLIVAGFLITAALAFLSYVRVEFDGTNAPTLSYRASETWQASATILVSERGFPQGVSLLEDPEATELKKRDPKEKVYSDPSRFEGLAVLYAKFAESDEVEADVRRSGPVRGTYFAQPMKTDDGANYLPFVLITATGSSAGEAQDLATRATDALRAYIFSNQEENEIPQERRVEIPVVNRAESATLLSGPSPVKPILILLVGLATTLGLAFVFENMRPRPRLAAASPSPLGVAPAEPRRSAQAR